MKKAFVLLGAPILAPVMALAEPAPKNGWETFANIALTRLVQAALTAARTQVDLTYENLSIDVRTARATITDLSVWPFFPWENSEKDELCRIDVARVSFAQSGWSEIDNATHKLDLFDVDLPDVCLDAGSRQVLRDLEIDHLRMPHLSVDIRAHAQRRSRHAASHQAGRPGRRDADR